MWYPAPVETRDRTRWELLRICRPALPERERRRLGARRVTQNQRSECARTAWSAPKPRRGRRRNRGAKSRPDDGAATKYGRTWDNAISYRLRAVQSESGCHGADDLGRLNAAVGVDDEARLRLFIHDPAARPFVVFGRCDVSGKPE